MDKAFDPEARKARMAARQTPEYGPEQDGRLSDLQVGDFVISLGHLGTQTDAVLDAAPYRKYRVNAAVTAFEQHHTSGGTMFQTFGHDPFIAVSWYPVRYRRAQ
jgi:hypothetical protein